MPAELQPNLDVLVSLFYARPDDLGQFEAVTDHQTPAVYRQLLAHEHHMTVTVEAFHGCAVDVHVLEVRRDRGRYCRRILLRRQSDGCVVQFGIVRLDVELLEAPVRQRIIAQEAPLGRILIEHNVLREIELHQIFRIQCGQELAQSFGVPLGTTTYGRTALIYCNREPAVELLEIVAPTSSPMA
jgi:chorismate-pyruvate lyase